VVEWLHKIPTKASIVQDTAYRTYIFGYLQNGEPIFGESLGDNELYLAVIDKDGTVMHFEHDSNYYFPNSIYYKLMYSKERGVNLFMSHTSPVSLGDLQLTNDSSSQNMFLARFSYAEPEDTNGGASLDEASVNGRLFLFPNPSKENLEISYTNKMSQIQIIDLTGKVIKEEKFAPSKNRRVEISTLNTGFYIIQVKSIDEWIKSSFVKE